MATATLYAHRWLLIRIPIALGALVLAWAAWAWIYPMPAARLVLSAGQPDGAYHLLAQRYAQAFAAHGIELAVLQSEGSGQNLERLRAQPAVADLALAQGGFGWSAQPTEADRRATVQLLANVDIEGLWIFSRQERLRSLVQLRGLHLAAGPAGSGHRVMAQRLLQQQRISLAEIQWSDLNGTKAADALQAGAVDAVFFVASAQAPAVRQLLAAPGIHLAALERTAALAERNNFLRPRLLAQDTLGAGLPPQDITLLTTQTQLIVRQDLDPALKRIATAVTAEIHSASGGPFHRAGDFPTLRGGDFPSAPQAHQTLVEGLNWLERHLPFRWAQYAQRLIIICIPFLLLAWWLALIIPGWLRWKLESRSTRWYGELKFIENDLNAQQVSGIDLSRFNARLAKMEAATTALKLPRELTQRWYTLHQHVGFVRMRVLRLRGR